MVLIEKDINHMADTVRIKELEKEIEEYNRFIQDCQKEILEIKNLQASKCSKIFDKLLKKQYRYTIDGLTDEIRELCPDAYLHKSSSSSYYDRFTQYVIKCKKCNILKTIREE